MMGTYRVRDDPHDCWSSPGGPRSQPRINSGPLPSSAAALPRPRVQPPASSYSPRTGTIHTERALPRRRRRTPRTEGCRAKQPARGRRTSVRRLVYSHAAREGKRRARWNIHVQKQRPRGLGEIERARERDAHAYTQRDGRARARADHRHTEPPTENAASERSRSTLSTRASAPARTKPTHRFQIPAAPLVGRGHVGHQPIRPCPLQRAGNDNGVGCMQAICFRAFCQLEIHFSLFPLSIYYAQEGHGRGKMDSRGFSLREHCTVAHELGNRSTSST